jgi:hypothetical protein
MPPTEKKPDPDDHIPLPTIASVDHRLRQVTTGQDLLRQGHDTLTKRVEEYIVKNDHHLERQDGKLDTAVAVSAKTAGLVERLIVEVDGQNHSKLRVQTEQEVSQIKFTTHKKQKRHDLVYKLLYGFLYAVGLTLGTLAVEHWIMGK